MARSKVREEQRQRIAKACLDCQASKQKCDGKTPCLQCLKRGRSNSCAYSTHERSYGRQRKPTRLESLSPSAVQTSPRAPDRTPSRGIRNDPEWNGQNSADITVPKLPHHLYDVNGRVCTWPSRIHHCSQRCVSADSLQCTWETAQLSAFCSIFRS